MEFFGMFGILGFLAVLLFPILAFIFASQAKGIASLLELRMRKIEAELVALRQSAAGEAGIAAAPEVAPEPSQVRSEPAPAAEESKAPEPEAVQGASQPGESAAPTGQPAPPRKRRTWEEIEQAIGARWSVILGGIAVALGAIFLVRYTIEAGLLGPGARIAAAALFSAALFGAGEWLRRRDTRLNLPAIANADIPGILTGAGAIGAFATVYAAYALYGFIGPAVAFVLLTAVGLASLALSAIHGPKLAALGVVGAYGAPALVSTAEPNPVALALHVLIVTASVMGLARLRQWLWLAFCGVAGGVGWTALSAGIDQPANAVVGLVLMLGVAAMIAGTFAWRILPTPNPPQDLPLDKMGLIALAVAALGFLTQLFGNPNLPIAVAGAAGALLLAACAWRWPSYAPISAASAVVTFAAIRMLALDRRIEGGLVNQESILLGQVPADIPAYLGAAALVAVPAAAVLLHGAWRSGATAPRTSGWLASGTAAIALLALVFTYLRIAPFETRPGFGAAGLALAIAFAGLTDRFARLRPDDMTAPAPAAFAVAGVAALCFAIGVSLDSGWFPLAFSLTAAGIAYVHRARPVASLPWLAVAAAVIGAGSLWASLPFDAAIVGTTPVLNRLIILLGLPAAAMIAGGEILRRDGSALPANIVGALGLAVSGLFVGTEIRHWLSGGNLNAPGFTLAEAAAQTLAALGFTAGLQRAGAFTGADLYRHASTVAGAIGAAWIALALLLFENPAFTDESVGARRLFNMLLPGYLLTGIAAGLVALHARPVRPRWFTLGFAALSGLLLFAFVTLSVRHAWQGEFLGAWRYTSDNEFWTYSAAWLVTGAAVLAIGIGLKSMPVRLASALLIGLTVSKVFLLDLSALTGALRAFSFIGLGLSLLAIGRFYQRILMRPRTPEAAAGAPAPETEG